MSASQSRILQHWYRSRQIAHLNAALSYRRDHLSGTSSIDDRAFLAWAYADEFIKEWEKRYPMPESE